MSLNISKKYLPILISELEKDYSILLQYLNNNKTFIISGNESCGKLTIILTYLKYLNYDYNIIEPDITIDYFNNYYKLKSKSVLSHLYEQKYVLIIYDFDLFELKLQKLILNNLQNNFYIIFTNTYYNKINILNIEKPSYNYLSSIYLNIFYLETNETNLELPYIKSFNDLYTYLNMNINLFNNNKKLITSFIYDTYYIDDVNLIIQEKNFNTKLYLLSKFSNKNKIINNLIYNIEDINLLANSYELISISYTYSFQLKLNYNEIFSSINILGPLSYIKKKTFNYY